MWLDNLKELKKEKNLSTKRLAELANLPEKTVIRILSGQTANPYLDTLDRLATALGCSSVGDILAGTKAVVGDTSMTEMQAQINELSAKIEELTAQLELVTKDNAIQIEKVNVLTKELDLSNLKLMYTEKLLATHEHYLKTVKD
jgi:transcriptional regulator with XRE-family HTH domain